MTTLTSTSFTVPLAGGRHLAAEARGVGSPIVVFEAGMGASSAAWGAVVPAVAQQVRTVVYDRAGLGRSPRDPEPRPLARLVDDLLALVDHLGPGPLVLVGHSYGGPMCRIAAARRPDRVAGLVLVDQTDEQCPLYHTRAMHMQSNLMAALLPFAARVGLMRMIVRRGAAPLPAELAAAVVANDATVAAARGMAAELRPSGADLLALRDDPPVVPDIAVTLVSGTRKVRFTAKTRTALLAAHRARVAASPRGKFVEAARSAHLVPFTEPDVVAREVLAVVAEVRAQAER
jgi:pimeloyl-ACP methyl ester carboxylesterase